MQGSGECVVFYALGSELKQVEQGTAAIGQELLIILTARQLQETPLPLVPERLPDIKNRKYSAVVKSFFQPE